MKFFLSTSILFLAGANLVSSNHLCSKYTTALFVNDTGANQLTLMETVVNLAVLGDADMNVSGILAPEGGLVGFFSGAAGNTTNRGGTTGVSINFLDGASNQETLLVHLYQFFGRFLGCSAAGFPAYTGVPDMYDVHKFMDITLDQNNYFIGQVGAAALALGVTAEDVATIGNLLSTTFNTRCPPIITNTTIAPEILIGTNPSICQDESCPLAVNATCDDNGGSGTTPPIVDGDATICMKYTSAVFMNDTADNELALITLVVNLAVLGDAEMNVSGILAEEGGLLGFFSGAAGNTTNRGGSTGVSINFLDGASNQEILLVHLYQFFGALLGCTAAGFPQYEGVADMWEVHKFMDITLEQNNYFIGQVGAAALALGVSADDVAIIANVLDVTFNTRCPPLLDDTDGVPSFLVGTNPSICQDDSCPLAAENATCLDAPVAAPNAAPTSYGAPVAAPTPDATPDATICMKYTSAVFMNDTADNELALITLVVNLAVLGDAEMNVSGILAEEGGLLGFFSGAAGNTTNRGGSTGVSINFLDGASNQEILLVHLYQFFGALLGCTAAGFPQYEGVADMWEVHKFMDITLEQNNYFIGQVGAAALALGVSADDVAIIANVLDVTFNTRCPPLLDDTDGVPSFLVGTNPSICQDDSCPLAAENATCLDAPVAAPTPAVVDGDTLCAKYTKALFTNNTFDNQLALITAVVDLAVVGDPDMDVEGIIADEGGLKSIFDGTAGQTANRGGTAVQINFLDGADNTSNLLEHLYQFFGGVLGCTAAGFPQYEGVPDMFQVHKFMGITLEQNTYFIGQVGKAATALGVEDSDVTTIASVLDSVFNTRCPPVLTTSDGVPSFLVGTNPSICQDAETCPVDEDSVDTACSNVASPTKSPVMRAPAAPPASTSDAVSSTKSTVTIMLSTVAFCFM